MASGNSSAEEEHLVRYAGKISYGRRVDWKISRFVTLIHDAKHAVYSPEFTLENRSWHLFTQLKDSFDIGVYQVSNKVSDFNVRLGVTKKNAEYSCSGMLSCGGRGTFNLIKRSEFDSNQDQWLHDGVLRVFFIIEDLTNDNNEKSSVQETSNIDVRKLQTDLEFLLKGDISDIVVKTGDKEFKCHRCILASRSPVFLAMMTHDTKEKATGVIEIKDADPSIVSGFLHYLYTGSVINMTTQSVPDMYTISDKYQVSEFKNYCVKYMLKNISMESFCDFIAISLRHNERELIDACIQFFKETWNSLEIIKTSKWQEFMTENPIACNELLIKLLEAKKS